MCLDTGPADVVQQLPARCSRDRISGWRGGLRSVSIDTLTVMPERSVMEG